MRPEARALGIAASVAATIFAIIAFLGLDPIYMILSGGTVAAAAFLGIPYLPKYPVREVRAAPEDTLAYLASRLRLAGHRVAQSPSMLTVRIGSFAAVRVFARPTASGSRVSYQPYATPSGWGTLITLVVLGWTGLGGLALALYGFVRVWSFTSSRLAPTLPADGGLPATPPSDETRTALLEAMSEAQRVAAEAHEALRATYWDYQAIVLLAAILVWVVLFIGLGPSIPEPDFLTRMRTSAVLATAVTVGVAGSTAWLIRRRIRPRILRQRERAEHLERAFAREAARKAPEGGEPSSFELLVEASNEVPTWIETSRRGGISRDPAAGIILVMILVWTYGLVSAALFYLWADVVLGLVLAGLGVALGLGAFWFYRSWRRRWDSETVRALGDWKRRLAVVRARMEQYLEDL